MGDAVDRVGFEELYARAGDDLGTVPWASLAPHPALAGWLERAPEPFGLTALVIGCGLGDDAEAVSRHGYRVTAFDVAPSAIARCRQRFPGSGVSYRVADLFGLPQTWRAAFDLVVENRTLQSCRLRGGADAAQAIAGAVRAGGRAWVCCLLAMTSRRLPLARGR